MLARQYVGSYSGENSHQFLQETQILELAKLAQTFVTVSISDMITIKYWQNLGTIMDTTKQMIPKQFIIGDIFFTQLATNEGDFSTRNPKSTNHLHKDSSDLLSVIIIMRKYFDGGVFLLNGMNTNDTGKRAHVLKHSHKSFLVVAFDKLLHKGSMWKVNRYFYLLSYKNQFFFTLYIRVQHFMTGI